MWPGAAFEAQGFTFSGEQDKPHHTPSDSPFVQTLLHRYEQYTGLEGDVPVHRRPAPMCTISPRGGFWLHPAGFDAHPHGADERIRVSDLMVSAKMFAHIILDLCAQ